MRYGNFEHLVIPSGAELVTRHARHALSRRVFMGSMVAAAGIGLAPGVALAGKKSNPAPNPTANTFTVGGVTFHLTPSVGDGTDPSSINDLNGKVGVAFVQGTGTATNPDGTTEKLLFDTDMRFMSGVYVGVDGAVHHGAFALV